MEIPSHYNPEETEDKWYKHWVDMNFFRSVPDEKREPYCIVIPPPNVTGVLHAGHILNNTIQDVLVRRARMLGKNACWVPGTDHASIATEAKVVEMLREKGIKKSDLKREEFLNYAWEWKEKHGGIILQQLKKLGASCDWERTRFTMENDMSDAVLDVFVDLYKKGLVYRGVRMINWDPAGKTAVSDEEVIHKDVEAKLYYIRYKIDGDADQWITIATTRPETILGDTAVCVHPDDQRYMRFKNKNAIVPLINRVIPIIEDEYVDKEFGTGALKITPAHDTNDYELALKHGIETIDILNDNGTLNENAQILIDEDRFAARKKITELLNQSGYIVKIEDITHSIGFSERTDAVIEPRLSAQWFIKMNDLAKPALENVMNDNIIFHPLKFKNAYRHWMENIRDWCVSRQLWWGQRIPAWYCGCEECKPVVIVQKNKPVKCPNCGCIDKIRQDEDVLDTWFSSWLWPISVFDGFKNPNNADIKYYYPTNDLVTAPEILFFWVARMIIAGYEFRGEKPFKNVYLTGIVRDKQRKKMSKSLGNSPNPLDLIKKYGADGVRMGMLLCSPAGNDILFDEQLCGQGRNFSNKIWNAFRLIKGWKVDATTEQNEGNKTAVQWFDIKFNEQLEIINDLYSKYRISEALMTTYKLVWDDFCAWYLEMIKPEFTEGKSKPIDKITHDASINFFENLLKILHPFMPFITEEIWHLIKERKEKECIIVSEWPQLKSYDKKIAGAFEGIKAHITTIRNIRKSQNIPLREKIALHAMSNPNPEYKEIVTKFDAIVKKMCMLSELKHHSERIENTISFTSLQTEFFIPISKQVNIEEGKAKLLRELNYNKGFLKSVQKKLSNERFIQNAKPELIDIENKKLADTTAKIKALEAQLGLIK